MKTRQDNDTINRISSINAKKNTKLSYPNGLSTNYNENKIGQLQIDLTDAIYVENETELQ